MSIDVAPFTNLALFAGAGGLELGLKIAVRNLATVAYVEREAYAAAVLVARMEDETLDRAPVWDDVTTFDGKPFRGLVDIVSGGFPCQDLSVAGKRAGIDGERSGLWSEFARLIGEIRPRYVFIENVSGLLANGPMRRVLGDLADLGFDAEWERIPASSVGAPHRRERFFLLARVSDAERDELRAKQGRGEPGRPGAAKLGDVGDDPLVDEWGEEIPGPQEYCRYYSVCYDPNRCHDPNKCWLVENPECPDWWSQHGPRRASAGQPLLRREESSGGARSADEDVAKPTHGGRGELADADIGRLESGREQECSGVKGASGRESDRCRNDGGLQWPPGPNELDRWREVLEADPTLEPALCRVANGMGARMDRLRLTGNGVVPLQAAVAFTVLHRRLTE